MKFPAGLFQVSDNVKAEHIQEGLEKISSFTMRLRETVDGLSAGQLEKKYREGSETMRQLMYRAIGHVSKDETGFDRRHVAVPLPIRRNGQRFQKKG